MSLSCCFLHGQVLQLFCYATDKEQHLEMKGGEGIALCVPLLLCQISGSRYINWIQLRIQPTVYNEEDHDNLIANPCQNFLHFTCLILLIYKNPESILFSYKKTVVYTQHMQSRYSHLFGRLCCLTTRQKHFRSARKHSVLRAALLQDYYICFTIAS